MHSKQSIAKDGLWTKVVLLGQEPSVWWVAGRRGGGCRMESATPDTFEALMLAPPKRYIIVLHHGRMLFSTCRTKSTYILGGWVGGSGRWGSIREKQA